MSGEPRWTDEWEAELRRLRDEGKSASVIAARLNGRFNAGVSRSAVIGKCRRLGLAPLLGPSGRPPRTDFKTRATPMPPRPAPPAKFKLKPGARPRLVPAAVAQAPAPAAPPAPDCEPIGILQLTRHSCRWPIDPDEDHGWRYCGAPRDPRHRCYCPYHRWIELTPPARRRDAA